MATLTTLAVMAGVSAAVSAAGAISQGIASKNAANFQATVARQEADRERQQAAADADDFSRKESAEMATRRALMGASGVDSSTGSPLLASEDFAGEAALQALRIKNGGEVQATRLEQSAALQDASGSNALTGGFLSAGGSLLNGGVRSSLILNGQTKGIG